MGNPCCYLKHAAGPLFVQALLSVGVVTRPAPALLAAGAGAGGALALAAAAWSGAGDALDVTAAADAVLVSDDFSSGATYPLYSTWAAPGPKQNGWIVEEGSALDGVNNVVRFEPGGWLAFYLHSQVSGCTDFWGTTVRLPINTCGGAPMFYKDAPLIGSWSAQLDLQGPMHQGTSGSYAMQCGLVLFNKRNFRTAPYNAGNPNTNSMILTLVVDTSQPNRANAWVPLFQSPFSSTSAGPPQASPLFSLRLDYDHRQGSYTSWYRPLANSTLPWRLIGRLSDPPSVYSPSPGGAARLGIYAKAWNGAKHTCRIDAFTLRAVANTPLRPMTPSGWANPPPALPASPPVAVSVPTGAAGAPAALPFPLLPDVAWALAAAATNGSRGAGAPAAPLVFAAPVPAGLGCIPGALGAADAALLRLHADFTATPHSGPPGAGFLEPSAAVFADCLGHATAAGAVASSPGGSSYAWGPLAAYDTSNAATGRWLDIATTNTAPVRGFSSVRGTQGWLDPMMHNFDFVAVLAPRTDSPVPMIAFSKGGEPGACGWVLGVLPYGAGLFFYAADDAVSAAGASWVAPLTPGVPVIVHAALRTNAATCSSSPPRVGFDRGGNDLFAYIEPGGIAACIATCCAQSVCAAWVFAAAAPAAFSACVAGQPCCFLKSVVGGEGPNSLVTNGVVSLRAQTCTAAAAQVGFDRSGNGEITRPSAHAPAAPAMHAHHAAAAPAPAPHADHPGVVVPALPQLQP